MIDFSKALNPEPCTVTIAFDSLWLESVEAPLSMVIVE